MARGDGRIRLPDVTRTVRHREKISLGRSVILMARPIGNRQNVGSRPKITRTVGPVRVGRLQSKDTAAEASSLRR